MDPQTIISFIQVWGVVALVIYFVVMLVIYLRSYLRDMLKKEREEKKEIIIGRNKESKELKYKPIKDNK